MLKYSIGTSLLALAAAANSAQAQTAKAAGTTDTVGIADIIVTAQKRPESGQKAPLAVTSLDAAALAAAHVVGAADLQRVVPDLQAETGGGAGDPGGGNTLFTIRGLGASATGPQGSSGVAAHFDGVYRQDGISNSEFFDLERIEVDPGPQGTLYGRSAAAGAINIIPAKPELGRTGVEGSLSYGNYNAVIAQGAVNLALGRTLALRLAFQTQNHDGYYSNGYDDQDARSLRLQLLYKPSDALSVRLFGSWTRLRGTGSGNVYTSGNPALYALLPQAANSDPRQASISQYCFTGTSITPSCRQRIAIDKYNAHAEIGYDFGGVMLTVVPSYNESDQSNTNANAPLPLSSYNQYPFNSKTYTVEGRLSDDGQSKLKWVVGGNYYRNTVITDVYQNINALLPLGSPAFPPLAHVPCVVVNAGGGVCTGAGPATVPGIGFDANQAYQLQNSEQSSYAFFGQATYPVTNAIRLTAGARYNHDHATDIQTLGATENAVFVLNGAGPFAHPLVSFPLSPPAVGVSPAPLNINHVTFRVAVDADIGPRSIVYASVGTGYKPGGLNDGGPVSSTSPAFPFAAYAPNPAFGPETVTHYEIGTKNRFLGNTLQINDTVYYDNYGAYQNGATQVVNPLQNGALGFEVTNAGKARVYGDELSIKWQPSKADEFDVSVNYLHARFTSYLAPAYLGPNNTPVAARNYSGYVLANAPEWSGNVAYRHTFDLGNRGRLVASAFSHITSGYWVYFAEAPGSYQKSYTNSTLDLTWSSAAGNITVSAFVNNLENHDIKAYGGSTSGFTELGYAPPRTYGGRFAFTF